MKLFVLCLSLLSIFGATFAEDAKPNAAAESVGLPVIGIEKPISDPEKLNEVSKFVSKFLHKLDGQANGGNLEILSIHSATALVLPSVLYKLEAKVNENNSPVNCTIKVWEQPLQNYEKLELECGDDKQSYVYVSPNKEEAKGAESTKTKRQVPGGFQNISPDGLSDLYPKLSAVFDQLNSKHNDFDLNLVRVKGGRYQVVAGAHYIVNVDAAQKSNPNEVKHCEVDILENLKSQLDRVDVKCKHHNKTFHYTKE